VTSKRFAILLMLLFAGINVSAQFSTGYPPKKGVVSDYAGKLTEAQVEELANLIRQYEERTSIEFAVVVMDDLHGRSAGEYAIGLGNAWGVGRAGQNNGIVLLWAPKERAYSLRIADGLTTDLSDSDAALITQQHLLPNFKRGEYYAGLKDTVLTTMAYLGSQTWQERMQARIQAAERKQEIDAQRSAEKSKKAQEDSLIGVFGFVVGMGIAAILAWIAFLRKRMRQEKLAELAQASATITDSLAKAEGNAPQIQRVLDDFAKEAPEQDLTSLRSELAGQPDRIVKIKLNATLQDFTSLQSYDDAVGIRTRAEAEADLLERTQQRIADIKSAKQRSQALIEQLSQENFSISEVRDSSRRAQIDELLSGSRRDYERARHDSSMSLVDWLLINEMLNRSQTGMQQAVEYSQEVPYTPPPSFSGSSSSSTSSYSSSFDSSSSYSSSSDGGGGFSGGSGSDGTY
jgi:uncharacterized membrane protein YgcG